MYIRMYIHTYVYTYIHTYRLEHGGEQFQGEQVDCVFFPFISETSSKARMECVSVCVSVCDSVCVSGCESVCVYYSWIQGQ